MSDTEQTGAAMGMLRRLLRNPRTKAGVQKLSGLALRILPGQITCGEFEAFVIDYHEGGLTESQEKRFEGHMRVCPMCRASFAMYLKAIAVAKTVFLESEKDELFVDVPQDLIDAILDTRSDGPTVPDSD